MSSQNLRLMTVFNSRYHEDLEPKTFLKYVHPLKHGASLYKEAELFSLPITNPKGRHKTKGLISKTMTLHVRYRFWYISLPSSAKQQREMNMYVLHCILIIYHLSFYISENVVL